MPDQPSTDAPASDTSDRDARRRPVGQLLVLLGLTGFAITQPLLDLLGQNPTVFTFNDIEGWSLVWLALALALIPALVLWLIGWGLSAVNDKVGYGFHLTVVGALSALTVVQILKWILELRQPVLVTVLAVAAGAGFAYVYARFRAVGQWARFTAILPAIAVAGFLFTSSASDLLEGPASATARDGSSDLAPVVVILLDEFPTKTLLDENDEIDEVAFPNLAAFAEDATWYRHFTTLAPYSNQAIPAILTGNDPEIVEPLWTEYPDNLFSLLAPTHHLSAFEAFTKLCGADSCTEGPPGSQQADNPQYGSLGRTVVDLWVERVSPTSDDETTFDDFDEGQSVVEVPFDPLPLAPTAEDLQVRPNRHQQFLDALVPSDDPALYFVHLVLPHAPFRFYPDGQIYDPSRDLGGAPWSHWNDQGPYGSAFGEQQHVWQAMYTDNLVGEALAKLKDEGIYDEALVVVLADHGASFELDTPFRQLDRSTLDSIAYAPLLIKAPGQAEGTIDDSNMMAIDVVPTMADILGIEIPWETAGSPAGSDAIAEREAGKYIYNLAGSNQTGIDLIGIDGFQDDRMFPRASDRWVEPIQADDHPLTGLLRPFGIDGYLGRSLDDLTDGSIAGEVTVSRLGRLERPDDDSPVGWVHGVLDDVPDDAVVLVDVNGTIESASLVYEKDGQTLFAALLPAGTLQDENEIRLGVVSGDTITEYEPVK